MNKLICMVEGCDREVLPGNDWIQVVGFIQHRSQGGSNAIALKQSTGKMMCRGCMLDRKLGAKEQQESLL